MARLDDIIAERYRLDVVGRAASTAIWIGFAAEDAAVLHAGLVSVLRDS